jgi:hypothetical protein
VHFRFLLFLFRLTTSSRATHLLPDYQVHLVSTVVALSVFSLHTVSIVFPPRTARPRSTHRLCHFPRHYVSPCRRHMKHVRGLATPPLLAHGLESQKAVGKSVLLQKCFNTKSKELKASEGRVSTSTKLCKRKSNRSEIHKIMDRKSINLWSSGNHRTRSQTRPRFISSRSCDCKLLRTFS